MAGGNMRHNRRFLGFIVAVLMLGRPAMGLSAAEPGSAKELGGLWQAKLRFGPDLRGPLIVRRDANGWSADFAGRIIPGREERGVISFELPDGEGSFRGRFDESDIAGHWTQSRTTFNGGACATPVRLTPEVAGHWRGEVQPFDDFFTVYLMLQRRDDGSYNVFLRNPERNFAITWNLTRLTRDGRVVKLLAKHGDDPENVFAAGTYDEERDILTITLRGGTYDFERGNERSNFYPRPKTAERYVYRPPLARNDGWPTGTLEEVDIDRAGIEKFIQWLIDMPIDSMQASEVHAVLIARHGKLVLEEYFHGEHRDKLHDTRSAAKSLTATLVGAAIEAGGPFDTSTPVYKIMNGGAFPPNLEARKKAMTVEHLLTMSSGFYCDDTDPKAPGNEDLMTDTIETDWYRYTLNLPMSDAPGVKPIYCSVNSNLLGGVLRRATGEPLTDLFDRLIARPMQFGRYAMFLSPTGDPYMGGGVHIMPRDFMKLGQLMLDGGTWHGRRILSRDWTKRASSPLNELRHLRYGYLWWVVDFPYKDRKVRAYFAGGNGGQAVIVIPELDMVVTFYGGNYGDQATHKTVRVFAPNYVLPAVDPGR
ncbi:MAG: serine hydrolase domain-containing protein [Thermoanaerobaculia bacterium]